MKRSAPSDLLVRAYNKIARSDSGPVFMATKYRSSKRNYRRFYPYGRAYGRRLARPLSRAGMYGSVVPPMRPKRVSASGRQYPLYLRPSRTAIEAHHHDAALSTHNVPSDGGYLFCMNQYISPGDALEQRQANSITMRQIHIHITAEMPLTNTSHAGYTVRYLVVYQKQTYGAAPLISDVLTSVGGGDYYLGHQNPAFRDKYGILFDDIVQLGGSYTSTDNDPASNSRVHKRYQLDLGKRLARWASASDSSVAGMTLGPLYLVILNSGYTSSQIIAESGINPYYTCSTRLVFEP